MRPAGTCRDTPSRARTPPGNTLLTCRSSTAVASLMPSVVEMKIDKPTRAEPRRRKEGRSVFFAPLRLCARWFFLRLLSAVEKLHDRCRLDEGQQRVLRSNKPRGQVDRSEEHTSELQSHLNLVCRLLLEKKKK